MVALYHCIVYALTPGAVYKIAKYAHQLTVIGILKTLPVNSLSLVSGAIS